MNVLNEIQILILWPFEKVFLEWYAENKFKYGIESCILILYTRPILALKT